MSFLAIITTIAGIILALGYYPQAWKIFSKKSAKNISIWTYLMFFIGIAIWLVYGFSINNLPIIISNSFAIIGSILILIGYFLYRKK